VDKYCGAAIYTKEVLAPITAAPDPHAAAVALLAEIGRATTA